jgi:PAS domain S-box-containing protein
VNGLAVSTGQPIKGAGQRRNRRELERSEQRFRLLVESVMDYAIFMLDPYGVIESWNVGAQRLKGYTESEIIGQHYSVFYPDEDREAGLPDRLLAEAESTGAVSHSGWRVRSDGSRFWADVVITALREDDGTLAGFAKVTRDMTEQHHAAEAREHALAEQRRSLERLEELDSWRRDFISSVTHDLQTPITSIVGFTELILRHAADDGDEEHREFLEHILSNARSLNGLIDHLQTHALLESGGIELSPQPINLDEMVHDLIDDMAPVLDGYRLVVELGDGEVLADRRGLERILRNLLTNAVRHTPSGVTITIRAGTDGDRTFIEVEDDGEGIDEELLPYIFERFGRGKEGGSGLGLAIVKQYVEMHRGEISLTSEAGEGATFRITLPGRLQGYEEE